MSMPGGKITNERKHVSSIGPPKNRIRSLRCRLSVCLSVCLLSVYLRSCALLSCFLRQCS